MHRLIKFVTTTLPQILPEATKTVRGMPESDWMTSADGVAFEEFAGRARRRSEGVDEDRVLC